MTDLAIAGLLVGLVTGALMTRGNICFNAALRLAVFKRKPTVLRIFAIAVGAQLLVLPVLSLLDVRLVAVGLFPVAQVVGGLVFGAGMALAGGCITGILWKTGAGSIATGVAIAGFAGGELLIRGPGEDVLRDLDDAGGRPADQTLQAVLGLDYELAAVLAGVVVLGLLLRRRRDGLALGLALGSVSALAWLVADLVGAPYGLGFTGTAEGTRGAIEAGSALPWSLWLAIGVIGGGLLAGGGVLRRPDGPRVTRALLGGLLMGAGANAAHGCNIGLGLAGTPTLSLGAMLGVAAMAAGALAVRGFVLENRPGLRGKETPEPAGW